MIVGKRWRRHHVTSTNHHHRQQRRKNPTTSYCLKTTWEEENVKNRLEAEVKDKQRPRRLVGNKALQSQLTHKGCSQTESKSENSTKHTSNIVAATRTGDKVRDQLTSCRCKQILYNVVDVKLQFCLFMISLNALTCACKTDRQTGGCSATPNLIVYVRAP